MRVYVLFSSSTHSFSPSVNSFLPEKVLTEQRCQKKFRQADTVLVEHIMGVCSLTQEKKF